MQVGYNTYYYYAGTFYVQDTDQQHYVVVQGPVGAVVQYLPDGYKQEELNDVQYYVYDGIFYMAKSVNGQIQYEVVSPPRP